MANSLHQVGRPQIEVADPIALGDARDLPDGSVRRESFGVLLDRSEGLEGLRLNTRIRLHLSVGNAVSLWLALGQWTQTTVG